MNRKSFLQRSALLTLAAAGVPRLARAWQSAPVPDKYISEKTGSDPALVYTVMLENGATEPSAKDVSVPLSVYRYPAGSGSPAESKYLFKRSGKVKLEMGLDTITIKREALISGADELPDGFPKTPRLKITHRDNLLLETSKGNFTFLKYSAPATEKDSSADECFLTTACTAARNLPDDCAELTTLRSYRDSFMRPSAEGLALISEYYDVAPAIVKAVNSNSNSAAIWDHVYGTLVLPAVALIAAGQNEDAGALYGAYVQDMKAVFLQGSGSSALKGRQLSRVVSSQGSSALKELTTQS